MTAQRLSLSLPDLPLLVEHGQITPDGQSMWTKDIYQGETTHHDHTMPLLPTPADLIPEPLPVFVRASHGG